MKGIFLGQADGHRTVALFRSAARKMAKKILDMERRAREHQKMRADCICGLKTNQHGQVGAEFLCHDPSRVHPYVTAAWDSARRRVHK